MSTVYSDSSSQDLRVMSYNVRYASAGDGDNAWPRRKDALADVIRAYARTPCEYFQARCKLALFAAFLWLPGTLRS